MFGFGKKVTLNKIAIIAALDALTDGNVNVLNVKKFELPKDLSFIEALTQPQLIMVSGILSAEFIKGNALAGKLLIPVLEALACPKTKLFLEKKLYGHLRYFKDKGRCYKDLMVILGHLGTESAFKELLEIELVEKEENFQLWLQCMLQKGTPESLEALDRAIFPGNPVFFEGLNPSLLKLIGFCTSDKAFKLIDKVMATRVSNEATAEEKLQFNRTILAQAFLKLSIELNQPLRVSKLIEVEAGKNTNDFSVELIGILPKNERNCASLLKSLDFNSPVKEVQAKKCIAVLNALKSYLDNSEVVVQLKKVAQKEYSSEHAQGFMALIKSLVEYR